MKDLWVPLSGALAQQRKIETLANNIANSSTLGFKKDDLTFREYLSVLNKDPGFLDLPIKEWAPQDFYRSQGAEHAYVAVDGQFTHHAQGELIQTNGPLDLAIQGKGFFEVLGPNGLRYTRKGNFQLNEKGEIVTETGFRLLLKNDSEAEAGGGGGGTNAAAQETTPPPTTPPKERATLVQNLPMTIDEQGQIYQGGKLVAKVSVVEFQDPQTLIKEGNSLYLNPEANNLKNTQNSSSSYVRQGYVEGSNVNVVSEMSQLINANRQFESIQRVIRTYDKMAERAVTDIGKF